MVNPDLKAELNIAGVIQVVDKLIQIPQTIGSLNSLDVIDDRLDSRKQRGCFNFQLSLQEVILSVIIFALCP